MNIGRACRFRQPPLIVDSSALPRTESRRIVAPPPEFGEFQAFPYRFGYLQEDLMAGAYHLRCNVDHLSPQCGRIGVHRDHIIADILLERLKKEKHDRHQRIVGRIHPELVKRKPLVRKIFQPPECQLAPAPVVGKLNDSFRKKKFFKPRTAKLFIDPEAQTVQTLQTVKRGRTKRTYLK